MKISIPKLLFDVLNQINSEGYEAFVVGGFVRDSILLTLRDDISDYDITTSAYPDMIKKIFSSDKQFQVGERHGTIGVRRKGVTFEITTYRFEGKYTDGRHPDFVEFVQDLKSDLSRRDFTINALAADKNGMVIDEFNGLKDLENRVIKTVGNPLHRFEEDSLRMFRAVRFAVRFGFNIDLESKIAITQNIDFLKIHSISGERVLVELQGILHMFPQGVLLLDETSLTQYLIGRNFTSDETELITLLITSSSKQQNHPMLHWILFFYTIFQKLSWVECLKSTKLFFDRFQGIGKQNIQTIKDVLEIVRGFTNLAPVKSNLVSSLVRFQIQNNKATNLELQKYVNLIATTIAVLENGVIILPKKDFQNIMSSDSSIKPPNGNKVKKFGYKNQAIGKIIRLSHYLHYIIPEFDDEWLLSQLKQLQFGGLLLKLDGHIDKDEEYSQGFVESFVVPFIKTVYSLSLEFNCSLWISCANIYLVNALVRSNFGSNISFHKISLNRESQDDRIINSAWQVNARALHESRNKNTIFTLSDIPIFFSETHEFRFVTLIE